MESKDESKEINIKIGTCYYFDDIMRVTDIDFDNISLDKKPYETCENILIYEISCKTLMGAKPLGIWLDEIDGFIKTYDGIRYLVLFTSKRYDEIYKKTRYLISEKCGITDNSNHNFARVRIYSNNSLPIEKASTLILFNTHYVNS